MLNSSALLQEADFDDASKPGKARGRDAPQPSNAAAINAADAAKRRAEALIAEAMSQVGEGSYNMHSL